MTPIPGKADTLLAQTTDFFYPLVDDPYMQVFSDKTLPGRQVTLLDFHLCLQNIYSTAPIALCACYSYDYLDHFSSTIIMITDQGRIACANVLSDLYAMGVVDCHNMLMLLAGGIDLDGNDENFSLRSTVTYILLSGQGDV